MKKLKYVLIALGLIILCVGGYIVYELNFKSYDTADPEVDTLIDEKFDLELPDGTVINVDKDGNVVEGKKIETNETTENIVVTGPSNSVSSNSEEDKTEINNTKGEENSTATNSKQLEKTNELNTSKENEKVKEEVKEKEKVTVSMIKSKYESTFNMLENQSRARLNSLISKAANEYSTKKSNGESISYGYFYKKYMGAAKGIESATDSTVSYVVGLVEKDLQANGYDKSYAQSFKEDYKATKEALRSEMMGKVLNFR